MITLVKNKKARHNYDIKEIYSAGIKLTGPEVKSLRKSHASLDGAYVVLRDGKVILKGCSIKRYQENNPYTDGDYGRPRELLLKKSEIAEIAKRKKSEKVAIIPLRISLQGKRIIVEIALARGKRKYDKREDIKRRDTTRQLERDLKFRI